MKKGEVVTWRRRSIDGPGFEKMEIATVVSTYEPYAIKDFPLHLGGFGLMPSH